MKRLVLFALLCACQKHDDPTMTATTSTGAPSAPSAPAPTATDSTPLTPLATATTTAPIASTTTSPNASSSPPAIDMNKRAQLAKQAEAMQMQMLQALGNGSPQGALNRGDVPPVDLSSIAAGSLDGGRDLRLGSGGGTLRAGGSGGGLRALGDRDH